MENDAYTDITNNTLGGERLNNPNFTGLPCDPVGQPLPTTPEPQPIEVDFPFGNAVSVIIHNSDHPNISNNSILGTAAFAFAPILDSSQIQTGFGIVTSECLGLGPDSSDSVTISGNLIDRNVNAGIWLCSDGGGNHVIRSNTIRNNGRGVLLRAISQTTVDANNISNDYQDALVVYDASSSNVISSNLIESQRTPGSAAIRLGGFGGGLQPVFTAVSNNKLLRNWNALVISGARNTFATNNTITAEDIRTGVLLQVGSTGATTVTQPTGTVLHFNLIVSNGGCSAVQGCAIRIDSFVTANVDAQSNSFGLPLDTDPNIVLWHRLNDPALGFINAACQLAPGGAPGSSGSVPAPGAAPYTGTPTSGGGSATLAVAPCPAGSPGSTGAPSSSGTGTSTGPPGGTNTPPTATPTPGPGSANPGFVTPVPTPTP